MKIFEIINPAPLMEGGKSDSIRYNSEIGLLLSFCGGDVANFDPENPEASLPASMLANPQQTYSDIKKLLVPNYMPEIFERWYIYGDGVVKPLVLNKLRDSKDKVQKFNWSAGKNINHETSADVEFIGSNISGVSVKEESGITLNNPTPKDLGIDNQGDMFLQYAKPEYMAWKSEVFKRVLKIAADNPGSRIGGKDTAKYAVIYDAKTKKYTCTGKKNIEATAQEILSKVEGNVGWQRAFGDWFVSNWATQKDLMAPLSEKISAQFITMMKTHLSKSGTAAKLLKFVKRPFFYANPQHIYYVPSIDDVSNLTLKDVYFANPEGATMKFYAEIGMKDSEHNAKVEIHVRYANGMFEQNPTARVQSLKDPQFLSWEELR